MHLLVLIPKVATFHTAYFLKFDFCIIVNYFSTGGQPSIGSTSKYLRVRFSRAIFISIFMEVNTSCIYTFSLGMEFFNLQVYSICNV